MSRVDAAGLREKAGGVLLSLYILAGRWSVMRLFDAQVDERFGMSILDLRFWIVLALGAVAFAFVPPEGRAVAGEKTQAKTFAFFLNAFFIYYLLAALWSPDASLASHKLIEVLVVVVASICVYKLVAGARGAATRTWFWGFTAATTGVLALIAIGKAVTLGPERLAVLGGGPNVFGRMMGMLCLASLFFWRRAGGVWFIASSVVAFLLVILSGSRGGILSLIVAVGVFFLAERVKIRRMAAYVLGACVLGAAIFLGTPVGKKAVATYEYRVNNLLIKQRYTSGRESIYRLAYGLGRERPIFGSGLAAFPARGYGDYCHNFPLEIFSEAGLFGLALLVPPFFLLGRRFWKIRGRLDGAAVSALAFTLCAIQLSGDFYDSRALFVFMFMSFMARDHA